MAYRFLIGLVGALPFSVALCAAFAMLLPGGWRHAAIGVMALAAPVWVGTASGLVAISSRRRLTALLAGGNAAACALFFAAKLIGSAN